MTTNEAHGYKAHSLEIYVDGGTQTYLPDILSHNFSLDPSISSFIEPGDLYPTILSSNRVQITKGIETELVEAYLDLIGVGGLCIKGDSNTGLKFYLSKRDECAGQATGSSHRSLQVKSGLIYPTTLTADHLGNAKISFALAVLYDGTNEPIVISDSAALPTIAINSSRWTIGPMTIGGVTLTDYTNLSIDFGFRVESKSRQSDVYDTIIEAKQSSPTIEVTTESPEMFSTSNIPLAGKACTQGNTIINLRKRKDDGTAGFVADGTGQHLKFSAAGVAFPINPSSVDGDSYAATGVRITCVEDASGNAPIVYTGASAIS